MALLVLLCALSAFLCDGFTITQLDTNGTMQGWDASVPGKWTDWQAWSELISLRRTGRRDFVFCALPKVGCTVWKQLLLRASGVEHWNTTDKTLIHNPVLSGLDLVGLPDSRHRKVSERHPHEIYEMMGPVSQAYKAVIVRDPAVRFLSSFLDRCIDNDEWARCLSDKKVPFAQVVENYEARDANVDVDIHFKNQTGLCGIQYRDFVRWTYVGKYEDFVNVSRHILQATGLWERFGKSGWGADGRGSFGAEEQPMSNHPTGEHHTEEQMCDYYTPALLERVRKLYNADYERFDYDIDGP